MSEALWIALIVSILGVFSVWGKAYFDYKAKKAVAKKIKAVVKETPPSNPNSIPGRSQTCIDHGGRLIGIETDIEYMTKDIAEIKDDIKELKRRKK